jgi:hypothetical protein
VTQAEGIQQAYRQAFAEWRDALDAECRSRGIDRIELTTADPLDQGLLDYLVKRAKAY